METKKKLVALLLSLCMVAVFGLAGCGGDSGGAGNSGNNNNSNNTGNTGNNGSSGGSSVALTGEIVGQTGVTYSTKWFDFTVNSLRTDSSFASITAANGNILVIANVTITNTFGSTQPFGTFDWLVDDDTLAEYIFPLAPVNDTMMPTDFDLEDGKTVTYDVVLEIPAGLPNPFFMYIEIDASGAAYNAFKLPIQ